jgi:serine/threonine-protein kinase
MALEYIEGRNLKEYLVRKGPPELLVALSIMRQVAAALQRAGDLGLIHRDIKPENILLTRTGVAKVADFGLSRCLSGEAPLHLTQSGVTMGTPLYMSPEQVEGKPLDPRSDIYSFGVTCYYMLAGHPPFRGDSPFEVALKHVREEPPLLATVRPDLPATLCTMIHKMMAKAPEDRYQTARDLLRDLTRLRESLSGETVFGSELAPTVEPLPIAVEVPTTAVPLVSPLTEAPPVHAQPTKRMPSRPRRSRWSAWRGVVIGTSVVLALALGVAFGAFRRHLASTAEAASAPPEEPIAAVSKPGPGRPHVPVLGKKPAARPELVMNEALQVGMKCLEKQDLVKAAEHFHSLENQDWSRELKTLGHLGLAVVSSLRGDTTTSADMLWKVAMLTRNHTECKAAVMAWRAADKGSWLHKAIEIDKKAGKTLPQQFQ